MKTQTLLLISLLFISINSFAQTNPKRPVSPVDSKYGLVTFSILTEGKSISADVLVNSISIVQEIGKPDFAEIAVLDGNGPEESFKISESDIFKPGAEIEIKLGYEAKDETVFKGWITKQVLHIESGQGSMLKIVCHNENPLVERAKDNESPSMLNPSAPELQVTYGMDILDLELSLDARSQASDLTKFRGSIRFQGSAKARVNALIRMNGLGKRFNGDHFISGVRHIVESGNWLTEVQIGVDPK